jgi:hypothetical protein
MSLTDLACESYVARMNASIPSGYSFGQPLVDQRPVFDRRGKRKFSSNQVMSKGGIIRPSKRKRAKYL